VVLDVAHDSVVAREKLHAVADVVAGPPLPPDVVDLVSFIATYYHESIGLACALAVPPLTGTPRRARGDPLAAAAPASAPAAQHPLNRGQAAAVAAISPADARFDAFLLHGITGSGKTEVYLAAADVVIARGGQVLILVPEINLTPQLVARVRAARPQASVAVMHSGLAAGERRAAWLAAAEARAAIVLGTRLAVFAPLPALGLIVVDEEHDASYKQQDNVRYHARDAAIWRAHRRGVPIVLGTATPSLETWLAAAEGRYRRLDLVERADPRASLPRIRLVSHSAAQAGEGIGPELRAALAARLERGEQSLVFVNRRGFAPSLVCAACKWDAQCPRCAARLTIHRAPPALRCHHCGHAERLPQACPTCGNVDLVPLGFGTQRLERALAQAFPAARIARVDRDSTRAKGAFAALRADVEALGLDILVGTQMLAKGHDFPRLTLVGVLGADNALYSADFRATERLAALLIQVAGRAGRADLPGEVIVQTDFPEHPAYAALVGHDYARFADGLLAERRVAQLPPIVHAALLGAEAHRRADVDAFLGAAHAAATRLAGADVEVFAPVPALLARRAGFERSQLVVQSAHRPSLQRFLAQWVAALAALPGRRIRWALDVDPTSFG